MEKPFRPIPLDSLARWIFRDLAGAETVLGIPQAELRGPGQAAGLAPARPDRWPRRSAWPPARTPSSPRTSWPAGSAAPASSSSRPCRSWTSSRSARPCIDAADETYNCEWSQELKLEQSFTEYLQRLGAAPRPGPRAAASPARGRIFAMSVGYNLEGIQSPRVQRLHRRHARRPRTRCRRPSTRWPRPTRRCATSTSRASSPTRSPSRPCTAARRRRSSGSPATSSPSWASTPG